METVSVTGLPHRRTALALPAVLAGLLLFFLVCAGGSASAFEIPFIGNLMNRSASDNPCPDPDKAKDIVLPMPGGHAMVFRVVAVPARGLLWSAETVMGISSDSGGEQASALDAGHRTRLSAPFTAQDIPETWKSSLPEGGPWFCYLIAKYEVTREQYLAVMDSSSASYASMEDARPVTDISWYEAMLFTRRYTEWLLENHPEALPKFTDDTRNTGFVRLPTEDEWEYAARGGQNASTDYLQQPFFPMAEGRAMADYAVFQDGSAPKVPARIGSRLPNPLGLYDTAGNVAEMTLDAFRFSAGGKLAGSAGGFVRKGGSYLSTASGILPGRRTELALFTRKGAVRCADLGFRPVISGINTPGGSRLAELQAEYGELSGQTAQAEASGGRKSTASTPMAELDRLIGGAKDPAVRSRLLAVRARLANSNILQAQDRAARTAAEMQNAVMTLEAVRNYYYRGSIIKNFGRWSSKKIDQNNLLIACVQDLEKAQTAYKKNIETLAGSGEDELSAAVQTLTALYRGEDIFNKRMTTMLSVVRKHCAIFAEKGALDDKIIKEDLTKG